MPAGAVLILLYVIAVLSPLLVVSALRLHSPNELLYEIARSLALVSFAILCLQPVLTARIKWIERPFGMDILSRFHRRIGIFAAILLLTHPILLAAGGGGWSLIFSLDLPWYIWFGKIGLVLLVIHTGISMYSSSVGLKFEQWRKLHYILAPIIILLVFVHSWEAGDDLKVFWIRFLWIVLLLIAFASYTYHKILKPSQLAKQPYKVIEVIQENYNVWTIKMAPPSGQTIYDYLPAQFQFITFHRSKDLPVEEHHWTISSSPAQKEFVSSTIKQSGDFTSTMGSTKVGDTAVIEAPFGRFSYVLHPDDKDIVFIAGGIGITPFISMLRYMRDTKTDLDVILLYANRFEKDILFRDELNAMTANAKPRLTITNILSEAGDDWPGEKGYVDKEKIQKFVHEVQGKAFYVCGPPAMSEKVIAALLEKGVPYDKIRSEIFSL